MRHLLRNLVAGTIFMYAAVGIAAGPDPLVGTWKMNAPKSQLGPPGAAPKSFTRVFKAAGDAIDMEITGIAPDGKTPFSRHAVFKPDGKDYPFRGGQDFDTIAVTCPEPLHYETIMKKAGKAVVSASSKISADGKVFSQIINTTDPGGVTATSTMVLDRVD